MQLDSRVFFTPSKINFSSNAAALCSVLPSFHPEGSQMNFGNRGEFCIGLMECLKAYSVLLSIKGPLAPVTSIWQKTLHCLLSFLQDMAETVAGVNTGPRGLQLCFWSWKRPVEWPWTISLYSTFSPSAKGEENMKIIYKAYSLHELNRRILDSNFQPPKYQ